jgi:hypothetical protein
VARRILIARLASIFVARISGVNVNFWLLLSLRLIAIGFDFRVFHARFARGGASDFHRPSTGQQEAEPRQADTTARVIRIRINRF